MRVPKLKSIITHLNGMVWFINIRSSIWYDLKNDCFAILLLYTAWISPHQPPKRAVTDVWNLSNIADNTKSAEGCIKYSTQDAHNQQLIGLLWIHFKYYFWWGYRSLKWSGCQTVNKVWKCHIDCKFFIRITPEAWSEWMPWRP